MGQFLQWLPPSEPLLPAHGSSTAHHQQHHQQQHDNNKLTNNTQPTFHQPAKTPLTPPEPLQSLPPQQPHSQHLLHDPPHVHHPQKHPLLVHHQPSPSPSRPPSLPSPHHGTSAQPSMPVQMAMPSPAHGYASAHGPGSGADASPSAGSLLDPFKRYQSRPRTLSISTTTSDAFDHAPLPSPDVLPGSLGHSLGHSLSRSQSAQFGFLNDRYAALSISQQQQHLQQQHLQQQQQQGQYALNAHPAMAMGSLPRTPDARSSHSPSQSQSQSQSFGHASHNPPHLAHATYGVSPSSGSPLSMSAAAAASVLASATVSAGSSPLSISAPSRRRSRSILSTSPHPTLHVSSSAMLATSLTHQSRSPKPVSMLGSLPSSVASSAMVHKASAPSPSSHHTSAAAAAAAGGTKVPFMCESCGKRYKHPNCLAKHRWEHTQHWKETSKLSISKHQQVQILEAASVLVGFTGANGRGHDGEDDDDDDDIDDEHAHHGHDHVHQYDDGDDGRYGRRGRGGHGNSNSNSNSNGEDDYDDADAEAGGRGRRLSTVSTDHLVMDEDLDEMARWNTPQQQNPQKPPPQTRQQQPVGSRNAASAASAAVPHAYVLRR